MIKKKSSVLLLVILAICLVGVGCDFDGFGNQNTISYTVSLNETSKTLTVNDTYNLVATISPIDTTSIVWFSSDNEIATVNQSGTVKGLSAGSATITAKYNNVEATCAITVNAPQKTFDHTIIYHENSGANTPFVIKEYEDKESVTLCSPSDISFTKLSNSITTGYAFTGWNTSPDGTGTRYESGYTYNIESSAILYAQWQPWVQLWDGGPKFAVNEIGGTYAWGMKTYVNGKGETVTDHCTTSDTVDSTLKSEYDIATIKWGDNWRTPTYTELMSLFASENVSVAWTNEHCILVGKNGNILALPINSKNLENYNAVSYWTSTAATKYCSFSVITSTNSSGGTNKSYDYSTLDKTFAIRAVLAE